MSYNSNQPPYGTPQGYPSYPPQPGHGGPPQGYHQSPAPFDQGQYGQPPPPQGGYYGGPPQGHPPTGPPPPLGQAPAPYLGQGYPPPPGPHGQYPPPPQQPQLLRGPPALPSPGYTPGQVAPGDYRSQADALRKAMKGFGTDEKALIQVLSKLDPLQIAAVRLEYTRHIKRDLRADVHSETSGYFRQGLLAVIDGPLMSDVHNVKAAVKGIGTKEWLLNEVILNRSNADLNAIKAAYRETYSTSIEGDVQSDLSFKTAGFFKDILRASRHEESTPINPQAIEAEVRALHTATSGRVLNDISEVYGIFARSSDSELRAIDQAFNTRYNTPLDKMVEKQFSGHMKDAFLYMIHTAQDPAMRDAVLLEDAMKGPGTKDEMLVIRVVRVHWNRTYLDRVKSAYRHRYGRDLIQRVRGETSGDYERLMVALLE